MDFTESTPIMDTPSGVESPVVAGQEQQTDPIQPQDNAEPGAKKEVAAGPDVEKAFAARLTKERDKLISQIYGGQGISTYEQYEKAMQAQRQAEEAQKLNVDPELLNRLSAAETQAKQAADKLTAYERKEALTKESAAMEADPVWGDWYKENAADIREIAEKAGIKLETARLLVLEKQFPKMQEQLKNSKKEGVQEFIAGVKAGNKPVEGPGAAPATVASEPKTFADARKGAFELLKASQMF